jgi:hypothetical protein
MHPLENPYAGINAHHNSLLQNNGEWAGFHTTYITYLQNALRMQLAPMGYRVSIEQSLQIRRVSDDFTVYYPDATIFDTLPIRTTNPVSMAFNASAIPISELLEVESPDEPTYLALTIWKKSGDAVAVLELLSPANKPPSSAFESYLIKRRELLRSRLTFIEIDFLHQQAPTFSRLRNYTKHEADAMPYRIVVLSPRPNLVDGKAYLAEFGVNEALPTVPIALVDEDVLAFDFDAPYQKAYVEAAYGLEVDYTQLPPQFDSYHPNDQAKIQRVMQSLSP